MDDEKAGPSNPVISQSANVVVQRLDSGFPTWNLTASVGDREANSEVESQVTFITLNDQLSVLTPEQLQKIGVSLQAEPREPKALSEGFETNETSQFNIVDVEQGDEDDDYLGHVLDSQLPHENILSPPDCESGVLTTLSGAEKDVADGAVDANEESAEPRSRKSLESARKSTRSTAAKDGEPTKSAMVKTNLNRKQPVRTSDLNTNSDKNGIKEERSNKRSSRRESGQSNKEETAELASPGYDVSHADHSYAGRSEAPSKVDKVSRKQSDSSKVDRNTGGREGSRKHSSDRRSKDRRSSDVKERGQTRAKEVQEEKRDKRSSSGQKKSGRRDRRNNSSVKTESESADGRGGESSEGDGRRPKRNSARNFKIEDLDLVSSEDEDDKEDDDDNEEADGESEWSEEEDPERLWCICRKPHDSRFMICCDKCEDWFHGSCVNVTKQQGKHMEDKGLEWFCPNCKVEKNVARKVKEESQPPPDKKRDRDSKKERKDDVKRERRDSGHVKREKSEDRSSSNRRLSKEGSKDGGEVKGEEVKSGENRNKEHQEKDGKSSVGSKESTDAKTGGDSSEMILAKKKKFTKPPLPKQKCIMTGCDSTAKPNTIYCSNRCILRHAVESLQLLHQEKWFSQGFKKDVSGEGKGRAHCEGDRVPVVEKHTNRLRTGLAAPTPEDLPSWLERHPTYEVLVPTARKSPSAVTSPTSKSSKDSSKNIFKRRESKERKEGKERRESKDFGKPPPDDKPPVKEAAPKESKKIEAEKPIERRRSSESESGGKQNSGLQSSSEGVRQNVRKSLSDALCNRLKSAPEVTTTPDEATKTAHIIEEALFKLHKDTNMKYKAKYRTLIFNLRDTKNKGLFRRVVQQKISPAKLVQMSSEQLASKELAQWREREAKHSLEMIVQVEEERKEVPIIKKTHKGEIEVTEEDDLSSLQVNTGRDSPLPTEIKSPAATTTTPTPSTSSLAEPLSLAVKDTTDQHRSHLFDLNCKICTGRAAPPEEKSAGAKKAKVKRQVSKAEELEKQEEEEAKKLVAKRMEKRKLLDNGEKTKAKKSVKKQKKSESVKELVARTPPGTPPQTPPPQEKPQKKIKSFWKGFLNMQDVAKFVAAAYHVSGPIDILNELFPDSLEIRGRIPFHTVWDYFDKLKSAGSTELTVLRFHVAHEEDKGLFGNLFNYFNTRERIGVVGFDRPLVKDFYIMPLPSHKAVPANILPFEGPGLSETRPHMLLGLIIIHKDKARVASQISPTQVQPRQQKTGKEVGHASSKRPIVEPPTKAAKKDEEEKRYMPPVVKRVKSADPDFVVPQGQISDPIVAQYGNVDPSKMKEEEIEPYSPSQEEREAPYDPTDVLDDLAENNAQRQSKEGEEPYSPSNPSEPFQDGGNQSTSQAVVPDVDKLNQIIENVSVDMGSLPATEIASAADAASNVTQNLLSSLGDSDLSEQQQLLIQLTRQVEEAKKALLDKQIESLQSEISRATNQMASLQSVDSLGEGPFDPGEEAGVLKAPADSSTMDDIDRTHLRDGPHMYEHPRPNFPPNMNPAVMGPNMPEPYHWQGPGMGGPDRGPYPLPPGPRGMMGPRSMGPGWGPRGFNGP